MTTEKISFGFPVTDFTKQPAEHFCDLQIQAVVKLHEEGDIQEVDIDAVNYTDREGNTANIAELFQATCPDEYDEIMTAARQHAEYQYPQPEPSFVDMLGAIGVDRKEKYSGEYFGLNQL